MELKKKMTLHEKIKFISNNLLRLETKQLLMKNRLQKIPDSIDKYFIERDFYEIEKFYNDAQLEFNMAKYLLRYVPTATPREK